MPQPLAARAIIGKLLLLSAFLMVGLAAAFWFGVFAVDATVRQIVAGALLVGASADAFIGLRFLGESS